MKQGWSKFCPFRRPLLSRLVPSHSQPHPCPTAMPPHERRRILRRLRREEDQGLWLSREACPHCHASPGMQLDVRTCSSPALSPRPPSLSSFQLPVSSRFKPFLHPIASGSLGVEGLQSGGVWIKSFLHPCSHRLPRNPPPTLPPSLTPPPLLPHSFSACQLQDLHSCLVLDHPRGEAKQLHKCIVTDATGHCVFDGNVKVNK